MQGWITEEIKKIKLQICTVCLGWSKLDKALVFGDVGDGGEGIAYIYMWQGPFGIMRPSSLSPHIVLLFFLWLLSLSLFLFLFLVFFSLSLSLALFLAVLFSACIFGHTILFVSHLCPYLSPLFSPICILNSLTIAILLISSLRLLSVLVS